MTITHASIDILMPIHCMQIVYSTSENDYKYDKINPISPCKECNIYITLPVVFQIEKMNRGLTVAWKYQTSIAEDFNTIVIARFLFCDLEQNNLFREPI